ncbi:hypothetical protein ARMSODRAFT_973952 [Armillaria solidipes]|uniref:Uncharacterized protein n=1 Tax=Armillaria solidipes TaxID=1076256 RepID=A0A2H3BIC6_9AGAR|nr:hypothetical protein ARMSODRAFT_973952 [Armillaria solidipes]
MAPPSRAALDDDLRRVVQARRREADEHIGWLREQRRGCAGKGSAGSGIKLAIAGYSSQNAALLTISNLFIAILMRRSWLSTSVATVVLIYVILAFLASIITFAYPTLCVKRHDTFKAYTSIHGMDSNCISFCTGPHSVPGSFQRFSTGSLYEWHSLAAIATPGWTGFSIIIIISQAGAWPTEMK